MKSAATCSATSTSSPANANAKCQSSIWDYFELNDLVQIAATLFQGSYNTFKYCQSKMTAETKDLI